VIETEQTTKSRRHIVVGEGMAVIQGDRKPKDNYKDKYPDWFNAGLVAGSYGGLRERFRDIYIQCKGMMIEARDALYQEKAYKEDVKGLNEVERCAWLLGFLNKAIDAELNRQIC